MKKKHKAHRAAIAKKAIEAKKAKQRASAPWVTRSSFAKCKSPKGANPLTAITIKSLSKRSEASCAASQTYESLAGRTITFTTSFKSIRGKQLSHGAKAPKGVNGGVIIGPSAHRGRSPANFVVDYIERDAGSVRAYWGDSVPETWKGHNNAETLKNGDKQLPPTRWKITFTPGKHQRILTNNTQKQ